MGERSGAPSGLTPPSIVISKPPVAVHLPQPDVSANRDAPHAKSRFVRPAGPVDLVVFCRREEPIGRPRTFRRSTTGHRAGRTPSNDEMRRLASAAGRAGLASINTIRATFKQARVDDGLASV